MYAFASRKEVDNKAVSLAKQALQTLGKVGIVLAVGVAFLSGLAGTVYLSLRSTEVKVPEIVGKDRLAAEAALHDVGLNLRQRATRYTAEAQPNVILDQSPKAGEVIKIGQTVAVVLNRGPKEGEASTPLKTEEKKPETEKSVEQNKNANTSTAANDSTANQNKDNQNREKRIKNSNNKNANNSNNGNANNRNATNANNANNRNANTGGNANAGNSNANANSSPGNANNSNANKRAPVNISTPPFNPTSTTP